MPLIPVVLVATLLVGLYASVQGLRDLPPTRGLFRALLALQALLLLQGVSGLLVLADGVSETASFVGYLVLTVLLLPGAFALITEERTKYGTFVLAAACLVLAVVETRLLATL